MNQHRGFAPTGAVVVMTDDAPYGPKRVVMVVDPPDVDDWTHRVLATRSATEVLGVCPECGAHLILPNRRARRAAARAGGVIRGRIEHGEGCPAGDASVPWIDPEIFERLAQ